MQLIDLIEVDRNLADTPRGLNFAQLHKTHCESTQRLHTVQSQDTERSQSQCAKNSGCQDTLDHLLIEAVKDVKSVDEALSLLRNLRDRSQISASAHESLSQAFRLFSKDTEEPPTHSNKEDGTQSPSVRRDADVLDEAVLRAAGIKILERKSAARPFKDPSSKRKQLTSEEAAEIYSMRPKVAKGSFFRRGCMAKSKMIAPHFGVTPKTVRDIWHARTWASATRHLWTVEETALRAQGVVESDDEDKNDPPSAASPRSSMDDWQLQNGSKNRMAGHLTSLPAISSLRNQAIMPALSFQLPAPSALAHPFVSFGQQQASMPGLLFHGLAQQHPMGFAGYHPGVNMAAHNVNWILPEVSPSFLKL